MVKGPISTPESSRIGRSAPKVARGPGRSERASELLERTVIGGGRSRQVSGKPLSLARYLELGLSTFSLLLAVAATITVPPYIHRPQSCRPPTPRLTICADKSTRSTPICTTS